MTEVTYNSQTSASASRYKVVRLIEMRNIKKETGLVLFIQG